MYATVVVLGKWIIVFDIYRKPQIDTNSILFLENHHPEHVDVFPAINKPYTHKLINNHEPGWTEWEEKKMAKYARQWYTSTEKSSSRSFLLNYSKKKYFQVMV